MSKKTKAIVPLCLAVAMTAATVLSGCGMKRVGGLYEGNRQTLVEIREDLFALEDNDFLSRSIASYDNINGKDVEIHTFYRDKGEARNNPNFSQAVMVWQAIEYKKANPEEHVTVTLTSFHLSVYFAACVVPGSDEYGNVKNLYDAEYNSDGYYRLAYLLVEAAKYGIETIVIGQIDASAVNDANGVKVPDYSFKAYFEEALTQDSYVAGKKVGDYMDFGFCAWLSYGDKSAADMMHNKTCTASHRLDSDGNELGPAVWTGSINVDGIHANGMNGNDSIQTATIVTEHEELRRVCYNYTKLMLDYCDQEGIVPFRTKVMERTNEQVVALQTGNPVDDEEQIIYLGTENDPVFELYFTPFGGDWSMWDTVYNPYIKYIQKVCDTSYTDDYIEFIWNNVKYVDTFCIADMMMQALEDSFMRSGNLDNVLYLYLPGAETVRFIDLHEGVNIGQRYVSQVGKPVHIKDVQLSYVEDGVRYWTTLYNSLNIHEGSMYHQTNTVLVVKETEATGNVLYFDYATMTSPEVNLLSKRVLKP